MTITPFERWFLWLTTLGTLITGAVYWWMDTMMTPTDPWAVINHPLQPWMLKAHIVIAPLLIFSVGLITSRHIWRHYRMQVEAGRRTGAITALSFVALVFSGYALQVFTAEALLRALAWIHIGLGVLYSLGVLLHWPATRQAEPRRGFGSEAGPRSIRQGDARRRPPDRGCGEDENRPTAGPTQPPGPTTRSA